MKFLKKKIEPKKRHIEYEFFYEIKPESDGGWKGVAYLEEPYENSSSGYRWAMSKEGLLETLRTWAKNEAARLEEIRSLEDQREFGAIRIRV